MKKMMITLMILLMTAVTGHAMSYEQARNEALFLTDKMAYELNLTDEQYEAAYEINLDYLMGVTSYDDVYGDYWERRNLDMSYVLLDWQWQSFLAASYFYRPLYWRDGFWHFGIYARYPRRDYFYFGRPVFYASYRGGHAWHVVGGHGWYYSRRDHFRPAGRSHFGMLDRWNRGDFRHHSSRMDSGNRHFGGNRNSSTRTTVNRHQDNGHTIGGRGGNRQYNGSFGNRPNRGTTSGVGTQRGTTGPTERAGSTGSGSFNRGSSTVNSGSSSYSSSSSNSGSFRSNSSSGSSSSVNSGPRTIGGGSFGTSQRSSVTPRSTSTPRSSSSSGSFGGSSHRSSGSSGSFGGNSHRSSGSSMGSRQGSSRSGGSFSRGR